MSFKIPINTVFPIVIPTASATQEGLMTAADKARLDDIATATPPVPATRKILTDKMSATFDFVVVGNNLATLTVTPNSTLTPTDLHIDFYMPYASHPDAVAVA